MIPIRKEEAIQLMMNILWKPLVTELLFGNGMDRKQANTCLAGIPLPDKSLYLHEMMEFTCYANERNEE